MKQINFINFYMCSDSATTSLKHEGKVMYVGYPFSIDTVYILGSITINFIHSVFQNQVRFNSVGIYIYVVSFPRSTSKSNSVSCKVRKTT